MQISITTRKGKTNEKLQTYTEEAVQKLSKFYDRIVSCEIILESQKTTQIAEMRLSVTGDILVVRVESVNIYKSIDEAVENLERKIKKYKTKIEAKPKKIERAQNSSTTPETL